MVFEAEVRAAMTTLQEYAGLVAGDEVQQFVHEVLARILNAHEAGQGVNPDLASHDVNVDTGRVTLATTTSTNPDWETVTWPLVQEVSRRIAWRAAMGEEYSGAPPNQDGPVAWLLLRVVSPPTPEPEEFRAQLSSLRQPTPSPGPDPYGIDESWMRVLAGSYAPGDLVELRHRARQMSSEGPVGGYQILGVAAFVVVFLILVSVLL